MAAESAVELRTYVFIDRMQPQYAAYVGTTVAGDIPVAGMSELYVEVGPGNEIFRVADVVLKSSQVKPAALVIEREFGMLEIHAVDQAAVHQGGQAVLNYLGVDMSMRLKPKVSSVQVITNVDPYQAQLINKFRKGGLLVPGETLLVMEVFPAGYIVLAANEAEKAAGLKVVEIRNVGRFGRMFLSGCESEVLAGRDAALVAIESLNGR